MKLFRDCVRESIRVRKQYPNPQGGSVISLSSIPETTEKEVKEEIEANRARGYDEENFTAACEFLSLFAARHAKESRQKRARAGADAKWKKRRPQK